MRHFIHSFSVKVLWAPVTAVVWVVPLRLLVVRPFCVIEVRLSPHLEVVALSCGVLIGLRIYWHALINRIINIIGLARYGIRKNFVCLMDFFELSFRCFLGYVRLVELEVWVILFSHFVIRKFDFFLRATRFDTEGLIQSLLFFSHVEYQPLETSTTLGRECSTCVAYATLLLQSFLSAL